MKKFIVAITYTCLVLLTGFALGWNSHAVVGASEKSVVRNNRIADREVQSKPEPLVFSVCPVCARPFADGSRREWKRGSRDIVWERDG